MRTLRPFRADPFEGMTDEQIEQQLKWLKFKYSLHPSPPSTGTFVKIIKSND